jgi:hypothetical protein
MTRTTIDLLPAEGFRLQLAGVSPKSPTVPRFVEAFGRTWAQLGPDVRHALISGWWTARQPRERRNWIVPYIALVKRLDWEAFTGCYIAHHHLLAFVRKRVAALPDHLVETLIAHELAHAYVRAVAGPGAHHNEDLTDALAESWGFRMRELRSAVWCEEIEAFMQWADPAEVYVITVDDEPAGEEET